VAVYVPLDQDALNNFIIFYYICSQSTGAFKTFRVHRWCLWTYGQAQGPGIESSPASEMKIFYTDPVKTAYQILFTLSYNYRAMVLQQLIMDGVFLDLPK
jgi:hypothetical protein